MTRENSYGIPCWVWSSFIAYQAGPKIALSDVSLPPQHQPQSCRLLGIVTLEILNNVQFMWTTHASMLKPSNENHYWKPIFPDVWLNARASKCPAPSRWLFFPKKSGGCGIYSTEKVNLSANGHGLTLLRVYMVKGQQQKRHKDSAWLRVCTTESLKLHLVYSLEHKLTYQKHERKWIQPSSDGRGNKVILKWGWWDYKLCLRK